MTATERAQLDLRMRSALENLGRAELHFRIHKHDPMASGMRAAIDVMRELWVIVAHTKVADDV